ncbi:DUF4041 domain-containing protein [Kribbella speibonae]|uniref:DUF4041 domain-containing protein n=1 Tax=Kribbella speibonae TaxID=1572660 RepID=UPI001EDD732A|nr:DUF4041 domain-containing protein [Kribbella speibonae]
MPRQPDTGSPSFQPARVVQAQPQAPVQQEAVPKDTGADLTVGLFGARGKAKELAAEVQKVTSENAALRAQLDRLGVLSLVEIEERKTALTQEIEEATAALAQDITSQKAALSREIDERRTGLAAEIAAEQRRHAATLAAIKAEESTIAERLNGLRAQTVLTEDTLILQEAGVYEYTHPLDDSVAYKAELARLQDRIKAMVRKDGGAVAGSESMTMNGSHAQGMKMVREFSKLLLRAYNNEADNLVRGLRPYKLATSKDRLEKARATIEKLGQSMDIRIGAEYHSLRFKELELTADFLEKLAVEKERDKEEKARLREERQAQLELQRQREKLERERAHYVNALAALEDKGDVDAANRMRAEMGEIDKAIEDVDYRAANIRAGYVYVISNLGAFGEQMVKVGMTRRLEPLDRIRELSDASVPFNFDVHAIHFSNDAVGVEAEMHRLLADRRVNRVNLRREFFYATPAEVRDLLAAVAGDLLEYTDVAEASEYHQSINANTADATEVTVAAG